MRLQHPCLYPQEEKRMRRFLVFGFCVALLMILIGSAVVQAQQSPVTIPLQRVGTSSFASLPMASDVTGTFDEIDDALNGDADAGVDIAGGTGFSINRSLPTTKPGNSGRAVSSKTKSNPVLGTHFQGLNFHDQRFANGGNQFSVEPPDQALCAGNGFVLESVNDVLQVYDAAGNALLNGGQAVDLNTF
jgi:hypothetical protein